MPPWVTMSGKDYRHAFKEIKNQRDRGAGIIATSILQEHLIEAIKTRFDEHPTIQKHIFKADGPLGSFASQIDLAFLLGLYPEIVRRQLHVIRTIRNDLAHSPQPVSFRARRELCNKLNSPKGLVRRYNKEAKGLPTIPFKIADFFRFTSDPRTQFISAVKRITMELTLVIVYAQTNDEWIKKGGRAPQPKEWPFASPDKSE